MSRQVRIEELFLNTQTMIRSWKNYFERVLEPENISPTQMVVMFYLKDHAASGRSISKGLGLSPSALAQQIDGLDKLGFISREIDPSDRRFTYFSLSQSGHLKAKDLYLKRKQFFMHVTERLSLEEINQMIHIQQKMINQIHKAQTKQASEV